MTINSRPDTQSLNVYNAASIGNSTLVLLQNYLKIIKRQVFLTLEYSKGKCMQ